MTAERARVPFAVVRWAAEECERQHSGEPSVAWMVEGWLYARRHQFCPVKVRDVLALGRIVEPRKARDGFRQVGVRVGFDVKGPWELVPGQIERLVAAQPEVIGPSIVVDEWYREYEEIHPFRDGNGRTGSILWNWLRGSLLDPQVPPDFWSISKPSAREQALLGRAEFFERWTDESQL